MLPDYSLALGSALLWAISAQVVNAGMRRIPHAIMIPGIFAGLLASLITGTLLLATIVLSRHTLPTVRWEIVVAGILTFPLGTGLYYLCGHAFGGRIEFASQFSNLKPLFSLTLAFLLLGEHLTPHSVYSIPLLIAGVFALVIGTRRGHFTPQAMGLGIMLALAWAGGEAFVKLGLGGGSSISATFVALLSGTIVACAIIVPLLMHRRDIYRGMHRWIWAFVLHGAISFCAAYAFLFESIRRIGLARTILINAFWPALAVVLAWALANLQGRRQTVALPMLAAMILLLLGSLVEIAPF